MPLAPDDPLLAVIAPHNVKRFRAIVGIGDDERITGDFYGWCKLVLLTDELAILFPRDHSMAIYLGREIEALRAIASVGLAEAPEVVGVFRDEEVCAHEFIVERRLPGELLERRVRDITPEQFGDVLEQLARLAARWHVADPSVLALRPARNQPKQAFVDSLLRPDGPTAVDASLTPAEQARFDDTLARIRALEPVLIHGDLHEGQVLVDDDLRVTGVLDWQTARLGHPFTEFDLGEWGTAAWRRHRPHFPQLRRRMWDAYAAERGLELDIGDYFEIFWAVVHAHRWPESVYVGTDVTGPREEAYAVLRAALER
ncbi:MAG: hypothetical protein QOF21_1141 [Actinomycetota bacterium]